jgi:hypothetical protein
MPSNVNNDRIGNGATPRRTPRRPREASLAPAPAQPSWELLAAGDLPGDLLARHRGDEFRRLLTGVFDWYLPTVHWHDWLRGLAAIEHFAASAELGDGIRQEVFEGIADHLAAARRTGKSPGNINALVALVTMTTVERALALQFPDEEWSAWGAVPTRRAEKLTTILETLAQDAEAPTAPAAARTTLFWSRAAVILFAHGAIAASPASPEHIGRLANGAVPALLRDPALAGSSDGLVDLFAAVPAMPNCGAGPRPVASAIAWLFGGNHARWTWTALASALTVLVGVTLASIGSIQMFRSSNVRNEFEQKAIIPYLNTHNRN